jgi:hypothetical protein
MKFIGRKLYLDWGSQILAITKYIGMKPESFGLKETKSQHGTATMKAKLVDVFSCMDEEVEKPVNGTFQLVSAGQDLNGFITDSHNWMTVEEMSDTAAPLLTQKANHQGKMGDADLFYFMDEHKEEIKKWLSGFPTDDWKLHNNFVYIFERNLAMTFKLVFSSEMNGVDDVG